MRKCQKCHYSPILQVPLYPSLPVPLDPHQIPYEIYWKSTTFVSGWWKSTNLLCLSSFLIFGGESQSHPQQIKVSGFSLCSLSWFSLTKAQKGASWQRQVSSVEGRGRGHTEEQSKIFCSGVWAGDGGHSHANSFSPVTLGSFLVDAHVYTLAILEGK